MREGKEEKTKRIEREREREREREKGVLMIQLMTGVSHGTIFARMCTGGSMNAFPREKREGERENEREREREREREAETATLNTSPETRVSALLLAKWLLLDSLRWWTCAVHTYGIRII